MTQEELQEIYDKNKHGTIAIRIHKEELYRYITLHDLIDMVRCVLINEDKKIPESCL